MTYSWENNSLPIINSSDLVILRKNLSQISRELGFSLVEQTKLLTAASEIARNTIEHGGGGEALIEVVSEGTQKGIRITFRDYGPGISDIEKALRDGYSSGRGMGLGLGGAKRLVNEFNIESDIDRGTTVTITRWK